LIGGLGAAPTKKALRRNEERLLEREPAGEPKGRPRAATQNGICQAEQFPSWVSNALRLGVQPKPRRAALAVA